MPDPLRIATDVALAVGDLLKVHWKSASEIRHKGAVDLVTDADLAAETLAVRTLADAFPDHAIIAEETRAEAPTAVNCWYLDPLDGTTNFAHRFPHFAVSLALAEHGQVTVAVVHDPLRGEVFTATRGGGAFLNGRPLRVSGTASLEHSLLATGFPYDRRERSRFYTRYFEHFLRLSQGIRRGGSAALDLCFVAAGRLDGFWEWNLKSWDTAAGSLIVTEAGGQVTDFRAGPFSIGAEQILATNGLIHPEMAHELDRLMLQDPSERHV